MDLKDGVLLQQYELGRLLGQGTFAKVHYARNLKTGASVAIKVIQKDKIVKVGLIDQMKREISAMRLVKHPNIVELYEVLASKSKIYLVMEYAKGGELFELVAKGKFKEDMARKCFQHLISAVDYCHSRGIYHRDLKLENLLMDESGNLKVTDFGLSALAESKHQDGLLHTTCGTPSYVAPEVIRKKGYDGAKADIWSCGIVLYVLMAGYLPFSDRNLMDMYRKIVKAEYKLPNWFAPDVRNLLARILDPNPISRISVDQIKEFPWFQKGLSSEKAEPRIHVQTSELEAGTSADHEGGIEPTRLNAFEIISFSPGFDLSGFFEDQTQKKEARFTSGEAAMTIVTKLKEIANKMKMSLHTKDKGVVKMEGVTDGRKGVLCIVAEIFEVAPSLHMVELKKANGDTLEYQDALRQDIRPALQDIVWAWQGEQQQKPSPHLQQEQLHSQSQLSSSTNPESERVKESKFVIDVI